MVELFYRDIRSKYNNMKHYKKGIKKYTTYCFLFLICISLFFSGCVNNNTTKGESENTTSETGKNITSTEPMPEEYNEILDNLINAYPWSDDKMSVVPENPELSYMYLRSSSLSDVGFALIDLDNNGQKELIISDINSSFVYDLYTISDGEITHLFDSAERNRYYLYKNGYIENQWSSSAASSGTDFYKLGNGTLRFVERITLDAYYALDAGLIDEITEANEKDLYFKSKSKLTKNYESITFEEYEIILQSYRNANPPLKIKYTLLSEYKNKTSES